MGFLDNSGDIILDAVLTDAGRRRMARGDGSFRISKFALGDDEINYALYDKNNPSGSAFYDIEILQTPILEAFTDASSMLKSKIVSYSRSDLLFLPVMKLNELVASTQRNTDIFPSTNTFIVTVNNDTNILTEFNGITGVIDGRASVKTPAAHFVRVDQGIDNAESDSADSLGENLRENAIFIEIDNRLGRIVSPSRSRADVSFINDDNIATYSIAGGARNAGSEFFEPFPDVSGETGEDPADPPSAIAGSRGARLAFSIVAQRDLRTTDSLFNELGSSAVVGANTIKFIDTFIKLYGGTTGYSLDIPVRFVKKA